MKQFVACCILRSLCVFACDWRVCGWTLNSGATVLRERELVVFYSAAQLFFFLTLLFSSFWTSRGHRCRPFCPPFLASSFIAHKVQQSHCSSIFCRVLLTHALALSASRFMHKKKSLRIYTSMRSAGLELTKLTYTSSRIT